MKFCCNWLSGCLNRYLKLAYYESPGSKVKERPCPLKLTNIYSLITTTLTTSFRPKSNHSMDSRVLAFSHI